MFVQLLIKPLFVVLFLLQFFQGLLFHFFQIVFALFCDGEFGPGNSAFGEFSFSHDLVLFFSKNTGKSPDVRKLAYSSEWATPRIREPPTGAGLQEDAGS